MREVFSPRAAGGAVARLLGALSLRQLWWRIYAMATLWRMYAMATLWRRLTWQEAWRRGVLVIPAGPGGSLLSATPPLTITDGELDEAFSRLA